MIKLIKQEPRAFIAFTVTILGILLVLLTGGTEV